MWKTIVKLDALRPQTPINVEIDSFTITTRSMIWLNI